MKIVEFSTAAGGAHLLIVKPQLLKFCEYVADKDKTGGSLQPGFALRAYQRTGYKYGKSIRGLKLFIKTNKHLWN